jgi:hypothetical protein
MDEFYTDKKKVVRVIFRKIGVVLFEMDDGSIHPMREKKFNLIYSPVYGEDGLIAKMN